MLAIILKRASNAILKAFSKLLINQTDRLIVNGYHLKLL
jgi:hypothetical protein